MSKESRRRQRMTGQTPAGAPTPNRPIGATPPGQPEKERGETTARPASSGPLGSVRVGRRERSRIGPKPTLFQRLRIPILAAGVVGVVALVGAGLFSAATQPVFACSNVWEPSPTATPPEGASPQPGYVQPDMGNGHPAPGTQITYTYCPPASGRHYNAAAQGPVQPRLYGPDDTVLPQGWIHNLEHGALVVLYRGDSDAATPEGQAALLALFDDYPLSPVCGFQPGTNVGPVFVRFDQMAWPVAALVWGRVLPLEELDTAAILELDRTYGERTNPEDLCPDKRVSPSPSSSAGASPSASVSASPSAAASASPSAVAPDASPSAAPSAAPPASPSAS